MKTYENALGSVIGYSQADQASVSPLVRLPSSVSRIGDAASRIGQLADRLCGGMPKAVDGEKTAKPSGVFAEIGESADSLNQYASRIEEALARIEAQLP